MENNERVKILFLHDAFEKEEIESAWAKRKGNYFVLDNILFYAKEFSLGDIIETVVKDGELYANRLIEESGHSTIRVFLSNENKVSKLREDLEHMGCSSEVSNISKLISVDIPRNVSYSSIIKFLDKGEKQGEWEYQEACISRLHSNSRR